MNHLGVANKILCTRIERDKKKVLERFRMKNAKLVSTPLSSHFKLSKDVCPRTREEMYYMSKVPYSLIVGNLMYAMLCT